MKKLFLFSVLIASAFLATSSVAFARSASVDIDSLAKDQQFEQLLEKIQDGLLSEKMESKCVNLFQKHIDSGQTETQLLTPEQKKQMNDCINAVYSKKFEVMEQKVEKLRSIISKLKRSGKDIQELSRTLEQVEERLELLKSVF